MQDTSNSSATSMPTLAEGHGMILWSNYAPAFGSLALQNLNTTGSMFTAALRAWFGGNTEHSSEILLFQA